MIRIEDKKKCCGCTACYSVCPVDAIDMVEDNEGFLYPKVNSTKCIKCGLCEKICPYNKKETNEKPPVSGKKTGAGRFFLPEKPEKTIRNL